MPPFKTRSAALPAIEPLPMALSALMFAKPAVPMATVIPVNMARALACPLEDFEHVLAKHARVLAPPSPVRSRWSDGGWC